MINPLLMPSRFTVVCVSVIVLTAQVLAFAVQAWYQQNRHDTYKVFELWILLKAVCSKIMVVFTSPINMDKYGALSVSFHITG